MKKFSTLNLHEIFLFRAHLYFRTSYLKLNAFLWNAITKEMCIITWVDLKCFTVAAALQKARLYKTASFALHISIT